MSHAPTRRRTGRTNLPATPRTPSPIPVNPTVNQTASPASQMGSDFGASARSGRANKTLGGLCFLVSWVHVAAVNFGLFHLTGHLGWLALAALITPALVTAWKVQSSRRSWWRWVLLWLLMATATGELAMLILVAGQAGLLYRFWVSEHLRGFRWMQDPATSPAGQPNDQPTGRAGVR